MKREAVIKQAGDCLSRLFLFRTSDGTRLM